MPTQSRRAFLKITTAAASVTAVEFSHALPISNAIALITDTDSPLAASESVQWAVEKFRQALTAKGIPVSDSSHTFTVIVSPVSGPLAKTFGNLPSHYSIRDNSSHSRQSQQRACDSRYRDRRSRDRLRST